MSITNVLETLEDTLDISDALTKNGSSSFDERSLSAFCEFLTSSNVTGTKQSQSSDDSNLRKISQDEIIQSESTKNCGNAEIPPVELKTKLDIERDPAEENSSEFESTSKHVMEKIEEDTFAMMNESALPNDDDKYTCETCGRTWKNRAYLKQHQATCSLGKVTSFYLLKFYFPFFICQVTCEDCQLTFKSEQTLMNHQIKYKCGSQTFEYLAANSGDRGSICNQCGFTTISARGLHQHDCKMLPMLRCNLCPYSTRVPRRMDQHKKAQHNSDSEAMVCIFCGYQATASKGLAPKYILQRHLEAQHNDGTTYSCDTCDFKDTNYTKVKSHINSQHRVFHCQECGKEEPNIYRLKQHALKEHSNGKIQCALCDFSAKSKYLVEKHQRTTHLTTTFQCDVCPHVAESEYLLKKHIRLKHSEDPSYQCGVCEYKCESDYRLKKHIKEKHTEDPSFSCDQCGFRGASKYKLTQHIGKAHR